MKTSPIFMLDRDYSKFTIEEKVSLLRELYQRLYAILGVYFSGYLVMPDEKLNLYYVRTCLIIEKVLAAEELGLIRDLQERYERPFESLFADWGEGDILWEDGGVKKRMLEFKGAIDEAFIKLGEPKLVDPATNKFLSEMDDYLATYAASKEVKEARWAKNVEKQAEKFKQQLQGKPDSKEEAKRKVGFIKD